MSAAYHATPEVIGILIDSGAIVDMTDLQVDSSCMHDNFLIQQWGAGIEGLHAPLSVIMGSIILYPNQTPQKACMRLPLF